MNYLSILEIAKRMHNDNVLTMAEVLSENNELFIDAVFREANSFNEHVGTVRTKLPSGTWRKYNQGIQSESSGGAQVKEHYGSLEAQSDVDAKMLENSGDVNGNRQVEDMAFVEGLSHEVAQVFIYGNTLTDPEQFMGLAPRLDALADENVVSAGGTGANNNTSIYIVQWGLSRAFMFYPKGSKVGLNVDNKGKRMKAISSGELEVYTTKFGFDVGFFVQDTRSIRRICNIGPDTVLPDDAMIGELNKLPAGGKGAVIYVNNAVQTKMDIAAKDKNNVNYSSSDAFGVPTTTFRGYPVRRMDAILNTESKVV